MIFKYCKPGLSDLDPMFCKTTAKTCQVSHLEPEEYVSMHEASGWAGILPVESSHTVALWVLAGHRFKLENDNAIGFPPIGTNE